MDVKKMLLSLVLVSILGIAVVASGCIGGEQTSTPTTVTQKETVTETKVGEQITLKVIGPWSGAELESFMEVIKAFEAQHPNIKVEYKTYRAEDLSTILPLQFESGDAPADVIAMWGWFIAEMGQKGHLMEFNGVINPDEYVSGILDTVTVDGKIYGVPQDTEARPFYARKDKLLAMGYTEEEIADMMEKFATGEYTLYDAVKISQEAIKAGVVKWGIWHRPKPGVDYFQIFNSFGVQYYDPDQGKLVFDKAGYLKAFQFFYDICNTYKVTPKNLIGTPWNTIHRSFAGPEGDVLFYLGGTWNVAEWMNMFGYTKEDIKAKFTYTLVPSAEKGKPGNTISHPVAYMVTSKSKYPELATLLILLASDARLNAIHAVNSGHLAIRYAELSLPMYAEDDFLTDTAKKLLPYATFAPNNDRFNEYNKIIFDAMTGLESGKMTPKFAVEWVVQRLRAQLKDEVIIK